MNSNVLSSPWSLSQQHSFRYYKSLDGLGKRPFICSLLPFAIPPPYITTSPKPMPWCNQMQWPWRQLCVSGRSQEECCQACNNVRQVCGRSIGVIVKVGEQEGNSSSENLKIRNLNTLALSLQLDLQHCPLVLKNNLEHLWLDMPSSGGSVGHFQVVSLCTFCGLCPS